jgi:hypothetical protein
MSYNGDKILATAVSSIPFGSTPSKIYYSNNGGLSWQDVSPPNPGFNIFIPWVSASMTPDGLKMMASSLVNSTTNESYISKTINC